MTSGCSAISTDPVAVAESRDVGSGSSSFVSMIYVCVCMRTCARARACVYLLRSRINNLVRRGTVGACVPCVQ